MERSKNLKTYVGLSALLVAGSAAFLVYLVYQVYLQELDYR